MTTLIGLWGYGRSTWAQTMNDASSGELLSQGSDRRRARKIHQGESEEYGLFPKGGRQRGVRGSRVVPVASDFSVMNMHWAQLEHNFDFTLNREVGGDGGQIAYKASRLKCSELIPVEPEDIWRIKTRSTDFSRWPITSRGVFVDDRKRFVGYIPVDGDDETSGISTFKIPRGATGMIVNARQHESDQDQTHVMKLCQWDNVWDKQKYGYTKDAYVSSAGKVTPISRNLAVTGPIPVQAGEIMRIANVHTGSGELFNVRGGFFDDAGDMVSIIPNPAGALPYPFNDVVVPDGATSMRVNFYYKMQSRTDTTNSISIHRAVEARPIFSSRMTSLRNKVWAAYGDSLTYYGDWVRMVENATGLNVYLHGYGSASANDRGTNDNFLARDDRIEHMMSCRPDIVTIFTGANWGNTQLGTEQDFIAPMGQEDRKTFYGAYAYIIKKVYSIKADVSILILEPTFLYYNYRDQSAFDTLHRAEAVRKVAGFFGLPLVQSRTIGSNIFTNDVMLADNVHLSMRGATEMARVVLQAMKRLTV